MFKENIRYNLISPEFWQIAENILECIFNKDFFTYIHSIDTAERAKKIAQNMNLSKEDVSRLYFAGLIHDVGKTCVEREILNKPEKLSEREFEIVKHHAKDTKEILIQFGIPEEIISIAVNHHEKLNGTGYPNGLKEDELSLSDKILTVADITSALALKRAYRDEFKNDSVREILNLSARKNEISKEILKYNSYQQAIVYDINDKTVSLFDRYQASPSL